MTSDVPADTPTVEVEQNERGWVVVHVIDGERTTVEPPYTDRKSAEFAADTHRAANDRWTGAAEQTSPQDRPENRKIREP